MSEARWAVPEGREALITELLHLGGAGGWWLVDWVAHERWIDARFRSRAGALAFVRLLPPDAAAPGRPLRTDRFTLALIRGRGPGLLAALGSRVAAREAEFRWRRIEPRAPAEARIEADPRELDVERLAFARGRKPALRELSAADGILWSAWLHARSGAAVTVLPPLDGRRRNDEVLMVARTLADAEAMADAALRECLSDRSASAAGTRELGLRLGYPSCCVEAFIADFERERPPQVRADPLGRSPAKIREAEEVWRRLDRAWVARPDPRINSLLFGERLRLISFDPCRFDCPAALALARALYELGVDEDPAAAAALLRELARPVAVDEYDRRAWVELGVDGEGALRITDVEPLRTITAVPPPAQLVPLLRGRGRQVRPAVRGSTPPPRWILPKRPDLPRWASHTYVAAHQHAVDAITGADGYDPSS